MVPAALGAVFAFWLLFGFAAGAWVNSFTSGRITTQHKHDFTCGLFEARLKVPRGKGFLPAFWLMTADEEKYGQWPECGLKSAITPNLGGDCKLDQESFLLEPVSIEDLHNRRGTRNFWCVTEEGSWSATGASAEQEGTRFTPDQDESALTAGLMWQNVSRESKRFGLRSEITSFVPPRENVEIMEVKLTNTGDAPKKLTCVGAVSIYGRSGDNLRDHRNVTSMLHRTRTTEHGVLVQPAMSFDEKGHRENHKIYYVLGSAGNGACPESFYPTVESFLGEGGTFLHPRAVYEGAEGVPAGYWS